MILKKWNLSCLTCVFITLVTVFFTFLLVGNTMIFGETDEKTQQQQQRKQQNARLALTDYNFIATGDWYCNEETKKTINNILAVHPELIITTGDQVKESPSAQCWIDMSKPIHDKMKIAIGNHDAEFANIYKQIVDYHNLTSPYYSHDFRNIHFTSMSTEHPFEQGSKQYEFIKNDLEKLSKNSSRDWIVVHQHKPLYSSS